MTTNIYPIYYSKTPGYQDYCLVIWGRQFGIQPRVVILANDLHAVLFSIRTIKSFNFFSVNTTISSSHLRPLCRPLILWPSPRRVGWFSASRNICNFHHHQFLNALIFLLSFTFIVQYSQL